MGNDRTERGTQASWWMDLCPVCTLRATIVSVSTARHVPVQGIARDAEKLGRSRLISIASSYGFPAEGSHQIFFDLQ